MKHPKLLAWAQLVRLPNVFTAFADIAMAGAVTVSVDFRPYGFALALLASGVLYSAGMVLNDWFDWETDAKDQPFRPIPSGRVSFGAATLCGWCLLAVGFFLGWCASRFGSADAFAVAGALSAAIVAYNWILKHTPIGPVGMGACRSLNVLFGLSACGAEIWTPLNLHLAAVVGVYIIGVTWFARTEEGTSSRRQLVLAALVMVAAAAGALAVPMHFADGKVAFYFPYLVAVFLFYVGLPVTRAIRRPEPKLVQAAVKRSIFGLVVLDALLAVAFVGWPGLAIVLLLLPATWLGKWVYST